MAEAKEILEIVALVVPVGAVVFQIGVYHQRLKTLEQRFAAFIESCTYCRSGLNHEDDELHERTTGLDSRVSRIEGRLEGGNGRAAQN